jgi:hypothetical protein
VNENAGHGTEPERTFNTSLPLTSSTKYNTTPFLFLWYHDIPRHVNNFKATKFMSRKQRLGGRRMRR